MRPVFFEDSFNTTNPNFIDYGQGYLGEEPTRFSFVFRILVTVACILTFLIFVGVYIYRVEKIKTRPDKTDLLQVMGLVLAEISNDEQRDEHHIVKMGVGRNLQRIDEWVEDIFETFDFNNDGNIDKRELKRFIDQSLDRVKIDPEQHGYCYHDLDDFFDKISISGDGTISRAELRNFLRKICRYNPDEELREQLGLHDGIPPEELNQPAKKVRHSSKKYMSSAMKH